jgi:hypothetical protein
MLQHDCVVAEALAAGHVVCICTVAGMHFAANGEASASSVLAVRVGTTVVASLAHLAVLAHTVVTIAAVSKRRAGLPNRVRALELDRSNGSGQRFLLTTVKGAR